MPEPASGSHPAWRHWYHRALPAYWIFLFFSTHLPKLQLPGPPRADKHVHFIAFGLLAFLFWRFFQVSGPLSAGFVWRAGIILGFYAALDEYLQQFVGRGTEWGDFLADLAGIVVVLTVLEVFRRRRPAR